MADEAYMDRDVYYDGNKSRLPYIISVIFLVLLSAIIAFVTTSGKTISPLPEDTLRVIFVSPMPTDTPAPTASPSATPRVKATSAPQPKATVTPEKEEKSEIPTPTPTEAEEEPTVTPSPTT